MVRDKIDTRSAGAKRSPLGSHSSPSAWSRTSRRSGRGMVTAELSVSILTALALLTMMCWAIYLVVLQLRCIDTASEVARQAARGDRAAVHRAEQAAPQGARVAISSNRSTTTVTVRLVARPFAGWLVAVPLRARAQLDQEPSPQGPS